MSLFIDNLEVAERYTEYGIRNKTSGEVLFSEASSLEQVEWEAFLYPNSEVVKREIYVTGWARSNASTG